jgi:hypothetical protein
MDVSDLEQVWRDGLDEILTWNLEKIVWNESNSRAAQN